MIDASATPSRSGRAAELPVAVERDLRPGAYSVRMKVQDSGSSRAAVKDLGFQVAQPVIEPPTAAELAAAAAVATVAEGGGPALALTGPQGEGVFGVQRFGALVGPAVARVEFYLDGRPVLTKNGRRSRSSSTSGRSRAWPASARSPTTAPATSSTARSSTSTSAASGSWSASSRSAAPTATRTGCARCAPSTCRATASSKRSKSTGTSCSRRRSTSRRSRPG